jgi:hypothetical protein
MNQHCLIKFDWFYYSLFGVVSEKILGMVKTTTPYQILGYKNTGAVVESELISCFDYYDPCPTSIPKSSNPIPRSGATTKSCLSTECG